MSAMRRAALMLISLAACALALVGGLASLLALARPATAAAPNYGVVTLGGLQYEAMAGRPLDPARPVDAGILGARERVAPGQVLFGAFVAVTNDTRRALPDADRIELLDAGGRVFRPLPLPPGDPYAYVPRTIGPQTGVPAFGTPPADNLAATGYLVLFRIPASSMNLGPLELVIHDPGHPAQTGTLVV